MISFHVLGARTGLGFFAGIIFLIAVKKFLDTYGHVEISDISSADLNKMFLIIFVMTLHSLTEGIGIGVSFGPYLRRNIAILL